jgi:hypothetical protein
MDHKAEQIGRIQGSLLIHCGTAYRSITEVIKHFLVYIAPSACLYKLIMMFPLNTEVYQYITMETGIVTSIALNAIKIIGIYVTCKTS